MSVSQTQGENHVNKMPSKAQGLRLFLILTLIVTHVK